VLFFLVLAAAVRTFCFFSGAGVVSGLLAGAKWHCLI